MWLIIRALGIGVIDLAVQQNKGFNICGNLHEYKSLNFVIKPNNPIYFFPADILLNNKFIIFDTSPLVAVLSGMEHMVFQQ